MKDIDAVHAPTEVKDIILPYPSIIQLLVDSHCEILWNDSSGAGLGHHPTSDYGSASNNASNKSIIAQRSLRSNMLGLCIMNSLTTDSKRKLRAFKYESTFNTQYDGAAILIIIVKMVRPDTREGCSYIKYKLENMKMSQLKYDIPKSNLQIA